MERTRHRPIPAGRIQVRDALIFAVLLACLSFTLLALLANLLSACLAMAGIAIYVGVYTHWLKAVFPPEYCDWRSRRSGPSPGGLGCRYGET